MTIWMMTDEYDEKKITPCGFFTELAAKFARISAECKDMPCDQLVSWLSERHSVELMQSELVADHQTRKAAANHRRTNEDNHTHR